MSMSRTRKRVTKSSSIMRDSRKNSAKGRRREIWRSKKKGSRKKRVIGTRTMRKEKRSISKKRMSKPKRNKVPFKWIKNSQKRSKSREMFPAETKKKTRRRKLMKTIRCQINSQSCRKWKIKMKTPTVKARKLSRSLKT